MMKKVLHIEVPVKDPHKTSGFFQRIFGWTTEKTKEQKYWFVRSGNTEISIGLETMEPPFTTIAPYIEVDSIDSSIEKVKNAGGKILLEKTKFGDKGYYIIFSDLDGHHWGLWEKLK